MDTAYSGMLSYWFLQTVAMGLTALLIPNLRITGIFGAVGIVVALAFLNATLWDTALFLSIPDTFSTHTLTLFLTNGVLFWILIKILPGIEVEGITPALVAPVVFTILSLVIHEYGRDIDWLLVLEWGIDRLQDLRDFLREQTPSEGALPVP